MLLNPSITSLDGTNPGFSFFDYDDKNNVLHSLRMVYLRLRGTYNDTSPLKKGEPLPPISDPFYMFQDVDFSRKYGLRSLRPRGFLKFTERLEKGGRD
jgi:hypothetical protein